MNQDDKKIADERLIDLEKYYKYIYTCKKCNTKFGSDFKNDALSHCPLCINSNFVLWKKKYLR